MFTIDNLHKNFAMLNRTLNRRNSKRFVIGDGEEENVTPQIEITATENVAFETDNNDNIRQNQWLVQSSSRLRQGSTLT